MEKPWYIADNVDDYDSPALLIYPSRIWQNIQKLITKIDPEKLRPHVKTNKMAEVCGLMLSAGIRKFKAATIAEAEMLARIQAPDVLLAYLPVVPKIKRLICLINRYPETQFSCLVDSVTGAQTLSVLFSEAGLVASIWIDLNVGMNRTGLLPKDALLLVQQIQFLPGLRILGLHAYDGHIKDPSYTAREMKCHSAFEGVQELKLALEELLGYPLPLVAGGTPTCHIHATAGGRQCSPGTFVFWDKGYAEQIPELPFEWAAVLLCRVISIPGTDKICVDLGYKSVAAETPLPRVYFLNAPEAIPMAHSEEHLVLQVTDSRLFKTGDVLYGIPWHVCPTVALYDHACTVEENRITGYWKIIDRKITC